MPAIRVGTYNLYEVLTLNTPSSVLTMRDGQGNRIGPLMTDMGLVAAAVHTLRANDSVFYDTGTNELSVGGTAPGFAMAPLEDRRDDDQPPQDLAEFKGQVPQVPSPDPALLVIEWVRYYDLKLLPNAATGSVSLYNQQFTRVYQRTGLSAAKLASIAQVLRSRRRVYYNTANGLLYSDEVPPG